MMEKQPTQFMGLAKHTTIFHFFSAQKSINLELLKSGTLNHYIKQDM